jgi:acyl-CoA dehydrogenase
MDFNDNQKEADFRIKVREFLDKNAKKRASSKSTTANAAAPETLRGKEAQVKALDAAKIWQAKKAEAGFAGILWPKEFGGLGGTPIEQVIYQQEELNYFVHSGYFEIGIGMLGPTMMVWGKDEDKVKYLPKMLNGEEIWCQLFSEPSAGSDLAGIKMKAEKDGDEWVLNGQKVWTSGAHFADYGMIVARSDPSALKHKGLTYFFLDMKTPGIEVKPIEQISGSSNFNEVFFNDVRIPDSQRLGNEGDGWKVSLTTLMNERLAVGDPAGLDFDEIFEITRDLEVEDGLAINNSEVRQKMADWYVQSRGLKYTKYRSITALSKGQTPGPELSIKNREKTNKKYKCS